MADEVLRVGTPTRTTDGGDVKHGQARIEEQAGSSQADGPAGVPLDASTGTPAETGITRGIGGRIDTRIDTPMSSGIDTGIEPGVFVEPAPTAPGFVRIWEDEGPEQPGSVAVATSWQLKFALAVAVSDLATLAICVVLGAFVGFGEGVGPQSSDPWVLGGAAGVLVTLAIVACRAWDPRTLGQGAEEWSRLIRAFVSAAIVLGLGGLAIERLGVRPWVFGVLPVAGLLAMAGRYMLRRWLHQARKRGRGMLPVLAVGTEQSVRDLVERTRRVPHMGWVVIAACTPTGLGEEGQGHVAGVPVIGDLDDLSTSVGSGRYGVVAVAPTPGWSPKRLHRLAWDLEGTGSELVVDPGLMEVAGPRLHVAPVDGLPLLRLTEPRLSGVPRVFKLMFDRVTTAAILLVLLPVFALIAFVVKLDGGPVFYRQTRVGQRGKTFQMIKFRSMVPDADKLREDLITGANDGSGPLFKLRRDPRVTRIGQLLRRYSLDELPQLLNVLGGSMSLVGPRPPLPSEIDAYTDAAKRKFLVRPGMTGLWQVSGRSDLSWEESVRLDLRYVENWSPAMDLVIMWKTVSAVFRGDGAY
jgi:exopolysaccharide biosynthesis polyprenyl glycosylphosphotransferase